MSPTAVGVDYNHGGLRHVRCVTTASGKLLRFPGSPARFYQLPARACTHSNLQGAAAGLQGEIADIDTGGDHSAHRMSWLVVPASFERLHPFVLCPMTESSAAAKRGYGVQLDFGLRRVSTPQAACPNGDVPSIREGEPRRGWRRGNRMLMATTACMPSLEPHKNPPSTGSSMETTYEGAPEGPGLCSLRECRV